MTIPAQIEALLLVTNRPLSALDLAKQIGLSEPEIQAALAELENKLKEEGRGFQLMIHDGKFSFATVPEAAELIKSFLKSDETGELTRPAQETLTIIAYRGPVTKPEIEQVRGVNCGLILRNLLLRGLIEERPDDRGEMVYLVTPDFLGFLGITSLEQLPDYQALRHHPDLEKALLEINQKPVQPTLPSTPNS
ncbi:MAG: SMC-Scp complex subunit ScpB [bacterium]